MVPRVRLVLYAEEGASPVLEWLQGLPERVYAKGLDRVERLAELGHELRRPEADYLGEGIYELRWRVQSVNYRLLYFFHGREAVVLSHGLTKEDRIPPREMNLAIRRKAAFQKNPEAHTREEAL